MATEYTEVTTREAPGIEAYKLGLMQLAKDLVAAPPVGGLPAYQISGQNPLESQAMSLAQSGVGAFAPLIGQAGQTLQAGIGQLGQAGDAYQQAAQQAANAVRSYSPYQQGAAQGTVGSANIIADASRRGQQGIQRGIDAGNRAAQLASSDLGAVMSNVRGIAGDVGTELRSLGSDLAGMTGQRGDAALALAQQNQQRMADIGLGAQGIGDFALQQAMGQTGSAQQGMTGAAAESMRQALQAQQGLRQAKDFGLGTAQMGIATLADSMGAYDPSSVSSFMSPYEQQVIDQTMADLQRASDIAGRQEAAAAIQAGAFGGSRQGILAAERGRNLLEQQGRAAAQLRAQGYSQAQEQAQRAFEAQQARRQSGAQLTGSLGQAGAGTALQAAQAGGQLGLQGTDAAMRAAQQSGQLGLAGLELGTSSQMQAQQLMGQLESDAAKLGISTEEMAGRLGIDTAALRQQGLSESGRLSMSAEQQAADAAQARAALGLQAAQQAMSGSQNIGSMGMSQGQMQGALARQLSDIGAQGAQLGLAGADVQQGVASGMGALGQAYGALGTQQGNLAQTGQAMQTADINNLMGIGQYQRGVDQSILDAQRQTALQDIYEPYQRLGFYSDILRGAPSTQNTITAQTSPTASLGSQVIGGATTAYGLGRAASGAGII